MEQILLRTLTILEKYNSHAIRSVISAEEFQEEKENIEDFVKLKKEFSELLTSIENKNNFDDKQWVADCLVYLHLKLSYSVWHIEQIHDLVDKLMKVYGEEVDK
jgi:hypothetical protein